MSKYPAPWLRIALLLFGAVLVAVLAFIVTGEMLPSKPQDALIFQNALLLIVLGSALLEHHYTKPADSVVNSLMGLITLISVQSIAPPYLWWAVTTYCLVVFLLGVICVATSSSPNDTGWTQKVSAFSYRPAVVLGRARLLFSIVFLSGLAFFYSAQDPRTVLLVIFWGLFIVLWPLKLPELVTAWMASKTRTSSVIGNVLRLDSPNVIRVELSPEASWDSSELKILLRANRSAHWILPLFSQFQEETILGTGYLVDIPLDDTDLPSKPGIYDNFFGKSQPTIEEINSILGGGEHAQLLGFIVERSTIGSIRFETLVGSHCHEGMLVWSSIDGQRVFYQIIDGETTEETLSADKHGYRIATAVQLGILNDASGFKKYDWLPSMNTAVFTATEDHQIELSAIQDEDFSLGNIPNSKITVGGNFCLDYNHHTAILGVTGSGKTELAFDLVRHAQSKGLRVVCIDLTAQYKDRLADLKPADLSISADTAKELSNKLFNVETGQYGAGAEKKTLNEFAVKLRNEITGSIEHFLTSDESPAVGLIRLEEISNTKATLWITELFMTCLLHFAREKPDECPKILVVVEEAHTVMPEPTSMGLGDFDSRGLVGKIAQIALQGRKYGVGLLILAQRTATVSKTVLTQCNTIISFTCFDDTSLGFLRNVFGPEHVNLIPNLRPLQAVAFGKWVRAQRPIVIEIPYDADKVGDV